MPYESNDELPGGVKKLPQDQQTKWRKVFNSAYEGTCKERKDRDECAAKIAWSQIDEKYKKNSALASFSMVITRASHNKQEGTFRWKAVASDTEEDFYHDNMSLELFEDFISRIEINELAPESYRSSFWQGGSPYVSVSHYPDLEGKAVPGFVEKVFVDGNQLRAYGQFFKNKLGLACYASVCKDLYEEPKSENPIRISIAFLDYGHIHKGSGYEFERKSIDDICPECVLEQTQGKFTGKIFKKGQLVHLALTRVPANERTSVEVEKSMTTRKEDAESIIGEELANEIEEEAKLVGKSQAMVIKSEEEAEEVVEQEEAVKTSESEEGTLEIERYIDEPIPVTIVEDYSKEKYKPFGGATSMKAAKDFVEAQKEEWRISDLWWAFQGIMDNIQNDETIEDKASAIAKAAQELKDMIGDKSIKMYAVLTQKSDSESEDRKPHELDTVFSQFKSDYDQVKSLEGTSQEKLQLLQESFNVFADAIRSNFETQESVPSAVPEKVDSNLVEQLSLAMSNALNPIASKLDLLLTQQQDMVKSPSATPVRRSIPPTLSMQKDIQKSVVSQKPKSETPKLRALIEQNFRQARGVQ